MQFIKGYKRKARCSNCKQKIKCVCQNCGKSKIRGLLNILTRQQILICKKCKMQLENTTCTHCSSENTVSIFEKGNFIFYTVYGWCFFSGPFILFLKFLGYFDMRDSNDGVLVVNAFLLTVILFFCWDRNQQIETNSESS